MVIGSRARADHPADAWSDLDTIAFVDHPEDYAQSGDWKQDLEAALGLPAWFAAFSHTGRSDPEWEFVLSGGLKIDIVFIANAAPQGRAASLFEMIQHAPYRSVFERGVRVLVDKSPRAQPLILPDLLHRPLPNQAGFNNVIATILLDLTRAVKLARRGELWRAARAINAGMQEQFLTLIEWHAGAAREAGGIPWNYGRFLEEWADPRILAALPATFAGNSLPGIRLALNAALDLLAWLGPETAGRLNFTYPAASVQNTAAWLRKTLDESFKNEG